MSGERNLAGFKKNPADWRWLIVLLVLGYASLVLGSAALFGTAQPIPLLLRGLGVPALEYPLMDLRGVAAWCDAWAQGKDPALVATTISVGSSQLPTSISHLPIPNFLMNYSPLVLGLGKLGLSAASVTLWGIGLALIYLIALVVLCGSSSFRQALFWGLLILSPASVLVVERGNLDELVFALLILALMLRKYPFVESGVILGGSVLKFFPIVALMAPWSEVRNQRASATNGRLAGGHWTASRQPREGQVARESASSNAKQRPGMQRASSSQKPATDLRSLISDLFSLPSLRLLPALLLFALFLMLLHGRLATISGSLGDQYQSAFGYGVPANLLSHAGLLSGTAAERARGILRLCALLGMIGSFAAGVLIRRPTSAPMILERARHAFFLSAPIMLGLFIQGPQMDYKWIFFLPMVPAAMELANSRLPSEALLAKIWLAAMTLYSYWTFFSDEGSLRNALLKQLLMWGVMFLSAFLMGRFWKSKTSAVALAS